ncbi:MAG: hypothetical protein A3H28_02740 [Acidobacteria bacterium RIFCSPLOWO2_02_FULL_61_28]|nr:MAG: hypothetical protein A3H28_02740 [Acidobacteria bacterium RIFCSPLOWO2_02_FULL_61_28]
MKHGKWELRTLFLIGMGLFFAAALYGQSVVDMARQTRSRKSGASQTGRVFTNENVARSAPAPTTPAPPTPAPAAPATAGAARPAAGQAPGAAPAAATGQPPAQPAAGAPPSQPQQKSEAELEKEYREKFAQLREALALEEKKADVMQRELNLMQNQFYTNPQDTLMQEATRSNINTRMQEIEAQKANVEKAKQAVAALEEELRVKGLPAGWAR